MMFLRLLMTNPKNLMAIVGVVGLLAFGWWVYNLKTSLDEANTNLVAITHRYEDKKKEYNTLNKRFDDTLKNYEKVYDDYFDRLDEAKRIIDKLEGSLNNESQKAKECLSVEWSDSTVDSLFSKHNDTRQDD